MRQAGVRRFGSEDNSGIYIAWMANVASGISAKMDARFG
jgi:hypothetical protein